MSSQEIRRFPTSFVWVHAVVMVSFTICLLTGLPLKFEWWWVSNMLGGHDTAKWVHRVAGGLLIAASVLYAVWILYGEFSSGFKGGFWPQFKDFRDFWREVKFLTGRGDTRHHFGKYSYHNKMEFWGGSTGIFLMSVSGLILWFPKEFGGLVIEVAYTIHSWEGVLALVAIYVWHVYHVHTTQGKPRLNKVWLTGNMSIEELKHEHPAEYESLIAKGELTDK
jgi:formate dehydrogenase subunit gamma